MRDPEDPPRLLESPESPEGLRELLERAREDVGTDAEVARLAAKLGPVLGPAPVAPSPAGASAAASAAVKLGVGALTLLAAGGAVWLLSSGAESPPSAPSSRPATAPLVAPPPPPSGPPVVVSMPSAETTPSAAPPLERVPPTTTKLPAPVPSEADLLEQARRALNAGDSATTLLRANEHARRYPRGVLVQEREVLAIRALRRLGRDAEADRRAAAFQSAYPGSAFQRKLQREGN